MAIRTETVQIAAADGSMRTFLAEPEGAGPHPGVIVFMEAFGLNRHIEKVAERIAAEGYVVVAPDVYYRDAPNNVVGYDELEKAIGLMSKLDFDRFAADAGAVLDFLDARSNVQSGKVGATGFCMGGNLTFRIACDHPDRIAAGAAFYGGGIDGVIDKAETLRAPLYLFFGENDAFISAAQVAAVESGLQKRGRDYRSKTYPAADHGFFCDERASYQREAADDAWRELKAFFAEHLKS